MVALGVAALMGASSACSLPNNRPEGCDGDRRDAMRSPNFCGNWQSCCQEEGPGTAGCEDFPEEFESVCRAVLP